MALYMGKRKTIRRDSAGTAVIKGKSCFRGLSKRRRKRANPEAKDDEKNGTRQKDAQGDGEITYDDFMKTGTQDGQGALLQAAGRGGQAFNLHAVRRQKERTIV
jgi:hypothetical protein